MRVQTKISACLIQQLLYF